MDKANDIVNSACIWVTEHPKSAILVAIGLIAFAYWLG